jgi:hypothetical protein
VSGFAFYERSLALYRDWELVDVLASVVGEERVTTLRELVEAGRREDAVAHLRDEILPSGAGINELVDDLIRALST